MQTIQVSKLLKIAFIIDAVACGGTAFIQLIGMRLLSENLALPGQLLSGTGWFLAVYAASLMILARSKSVWRAIVCLIILGNLGWAAITLDLVVTGMISPNGLGLAYLVVQSITVLGLAALEYAGLRASRTDVPARSSHALS